MTYFTFERHGLSRGEYTYDGDSQIGQVFTQKPLRERLALDDRPPRYRAKLPSGTWLPGEYIDRHGAAEALRAHHRRQQDGEGAGVV